jgi:plasmid stability protein
MPLGVSVLTFKRHNLIVVIVPQLKRATVYFDPSLHKALRVKAAHTDRSLSELVNAAVRQTLGEDARDLATFAERAKEPALSFEEVLKDLKRRGKL